MTKAPEPDEIVWENLEISDVSRFFRSIPGALITSILLVVSFAIIVQTSIYKTSFVNKLPAASLCSITLPTLYNISTTSNPVSCRSLILFINPFTIRLSPPPHFQSLSPLISSPLPLLTSPLPLTNPLSSHPPLQVLSRPTTYDSTTLASLDTACQRYSPDSFYATYNFKNASSSAGTAITYSFSACQTTLNTSYYYPSAPSAVTGLGGVCPHYRQKTYCPCVSTMATDTCSNVACYQPSNVATQVCSPFPASNIGYCYCQNKLSALVTSGSIKLSDFQSLISSTAPGSCSDYFRAYLIAQSLTYGVIVISVVINQGVQYAIAGLVDFEGHASVDQRQGTNFLLIQPRTPFLLYIIHLLTSLLFTTTSTTTTTPPCHTGAAMVRVFIFFFLNMAFSVLIAYGYSSDVPATAAQAGLFQGPFSDFTSGWYAIVGVYFTTSFIIAIVNPVGTILANYVGVANLTRWCVHPAVRKTSSRYIVTQKELDLLQVGPAFDTTYGTARIVGFIFYAMTYSSGVPLLMPLCCGAIVIFYGLDKLTLLRFEQRPPKAGIVQSLPVYNNVTRYYLHYFATSLSITSVNNII